MATIPTLARPARCDGDWDGQLTASNGPTSLASSSISAMGTGSGCCAQTGSRWSTSSRSKRQRESGARKTLSTPSGRAATRLSRSGEHENDEPLHLTAGGCSVSEAQHHRRAGAGLQPAAPRGVAATLLYFAAVLIGSAASGLHDMAVAIYEYAGVERAGATSHLSIVGRACSPLRCQAANVSRSRGDDHVGCSSNDRQRQP